MSKITSNNYQLAERYLNVIKSKAQKIPEIEQVMLFGSRAMNTSESGSDIDLAIKGSKVTRRTVLKFSDLLNYETNLPFFVDVVDYLHLQNTALKQHIDHVGFLIYNKTS